MADQYSRVYRIAKRGNACGDMITPAWYEALLNRELAAGAAISQINTAMTGPGSWAECIITVVFEKAKKVDPRC